MAKRFIDGIKISEGKISNVLIEGADATSVIPSGSVGEIVDSGAFSYSMTANGGSAWKYTGNSFVLPKGKWLIMINFSAPVAATNHYRCALSTSTGNDANNLIGLAPNSQNASERIYASALANSLAFSSPHYYENDAEKTLYWKLFREENDATARTYTSRFFCIRIA